MTGGIIESFPTHIREREDVDERYRRNPHTDSTVDLPIESITRAD
jgi:hypothetical protein